MKKSLDKPRNAKNPRKGRPGFPSRPFIIWPYYGTIQIIQISLLWSCHDRPGIIYGPEYGRPGIIYGPEYDQPGIINSCSNRGLTWHATQTKFSNIENSQLYSLRAIEPHSTFCICERYIGGQNSFKILAELETNYSHSICSQPLLR